MPPEHDWRDPGTILQIYQAALKVVRYTRSMDCDEFCADELTNNAVLLQLTVIGEATKRLSNSFRNANSHVPWSQMASLRDRLVMDTTAGIFSAYGTS